MATKFDGHGTLVTVSFYMTEADHPWNAGVTIRRRKAAKAGGTPSCEERWLPVGRHDALHLLGFLGSEVNAMWTTDDHHAAVVVRG